MPKLTYSNVMATIAMFIALGGTSLALTRTDKKPAATVATNHAGSCATGPDVGGPPANVLHPDAPAVPCNKMNRALASGRYLVIATADWYPATVDDASYPTAGKCYVAVDGKPVSYTSVRPGNWDGIFDPIHNMTIATQGEVRLTAGNHKVALQCAQIQGNFRISSSTMTVSRVN